MIEEVRIRRVLPDDGAKLYRAIRQSFEQLHRWMFWCHENYSIEETEEWVLRQFKLYEEGLEYEMLIENQDGKILGACGLNHLDPNRCANLGYWVRTDCANAGVATRAVQQLLDWARQNTNLMRLEIVASIKNGPSNAVAQKCGATLEGVARRRLLLPDGFHDCNIYAILLRNEV